MSESDIQNSVYKYQINGVFVSILNVVVMRTNHAHVEAALFAIVSVLAIYAVAWLIKAELPAMVYLFPTPLALWVSAYILLYGLFSYLWRK